MVKRMQSKTTEEKRTATGAQSLETAELITIWGKIESVRNGQEDTICFLYDGQAYLCNHTRPENAHMVGERIAKWWDFRKVQLEIEAELNDRGVSIRVDEPKKHHDTI